MIRVIALCVGAISLAALIYAYSDHLVELGPEKVAKSIKVVGAGLTIAEAAEKTFGNNEEKQTADVVKMLIEEGVISPCDLLAPEIENGADTVKKADQDQQTDVSMSDASSSEDCSQEKELASTDQSPKE